MSDLSGNPFSRMCCLISIRLSLPESVIGDLSMNCVRKRCKGREDVGKVGDTV